AVESAGSAQCARDRPGVWYGLRRGHSAPVARASPGAYRGTGGRSPADGGVAVTLEAAHTTPTQENLPTMAKVRVLPTKKDGPHVTEGQIVARFCRLELRMLPRGSWGVGREGCQDWRPVAQPGHCRSGLWDERSRLRAVCPAGEGSSARDIQARR